MHRVKALDALGASRARPAFPSLYVLTYSSQAKPRPDVRFSRDLLNRQRYDTADRPAFPGRQGRRSRSKSFESNRLCWRSKSRFAGPSADGVLRRARRFLTGLEVAEKTLWAPPSRAVQA